MVRLLRTARLVSALTAVVLILAAASTSSAHVRLTYPTGGESLSAGSQVEIKWEEDIPHQTENWDLFFSPDGGQTWEEIAVDLSVETRGYRWLVPDVTTESAVVRVVQDNVGADYPDSSGDFTITGVSSTARGDAGLPGVLRLIGVYPNPFLERTSIVVDLPVASRFTGEIYDVSGRLVERIADRLLPAGRHAIAWAPDDEASGRYVLRLSADDRVLSALLIRTR